MNIFSNIYINSAELEYILSLPVSDKIQYMFELYTIEQIRNNNPNINLKEFFKEIDETYFNVDEIELESYESEQEKVDVMIDNENILIESNNLRALRNIRDRFIENGFILQRDKETEKMFNRDKITKYLRIFRIINQIDPLCWN
jgi:uncharacterized protein YfeS